MISPNTSISVRNRLLTLARKTSRPYNELLQYYGMERFLYRLGQSDHKHRFVLKGALLFHVWDISKSRATRDIDLLAMAKSSTGHLEMLMHEICSYPVDCGDGVIYETHTIVSEVMQTNREYNGIRIKFKARLEGEKHTIPMQIDFGFGDKVTPAPEAITYPTLLNLPPPCLNVYPVETVIAEKLHTAVERGEQNSRVKDYHDVWILMRMGHFDFATLKRALERTFKQRGMLLDWKRVFQVIHLYGISQDSQQFWSRYRKKGGYDTTPENITEICDDILEVFTQHGAS